MKSTPHVSISQMNEWALAFKESKDTKAADRLVRIFQPMVMGCARRCAPYDDFLQQDLIQEGNMAILQACNHFDLSKSDSFFGYVQVWVERQIKRYSLFNWRLVRIPDSKPVKKAYTQMSKILGDRSSLTDEMALSVAQELNISVESVKVAYGLYASPEYSADAPLDMASHSGEEGSEATLSDLLFDPVTPESVVAEMSEARHNERVTQTLLNRLTEKEQIIIQKRLMVVDDEDALKLRELSEVLGVSCERVRQLEVQAIRKMKAASEAPLAA